MHIAYRYLRLWRKQICSEKVKDRRFGKNKLIKLLNFHRICFFFHFCEQLMIFIGVKRIYSNATLIDIITSNRYYNTLPRRLIKS